MAPHILDVRFVRLHNGRVRLSIDGWAIGDYRDHIDACVALARAIERIHVTRPFAEISIPVEEGAGPL